MWLHACATASPAFLVAAYSDAGRFVRWSSACLAMASKSATRPMMLEDTYTCGACIAWRTAA